MINYWTDRRLMIGLLDRLRKTGGYSAVKALPWGYYRILKDAQGKIIFETDDPARAWIIQSVIIHYESGTNF